MKEIKEKEKIYLEEFDIYVNPYLTYSQIKQIVDAMKSQDNWLVREQTMDTLVLFHATDIGKENIEKYGHDALLRSGLIDVVFENIVNIQDLYDAVSFTESIQQAFIQFSKYIPELTKRIEKMKSNEQSSKK